MNNLKTTSPKHGYLIDMDGVLYRGSKLIAGADAFIRAGKGASGQRGHCSFRKANKQWPLCTTVQASYACRRSGSWPSR